MPVNTDTWKSWALQRILNRFPSWSRARIRDDSVAFYLLNPFGKYLDELYETLIKIKRNYYINKVDILEQPFIWTLDLPKTFEFVVSGSVQGRVTYTEPVITGSIGADEIVISVADEPALQEIDKATVVPTRLDIALVTTGFNDVVVPETSIVALGDVTLNDAFLAEMGTVYVEVEDGIQFGETLSDGTIVTPKVIIKGIPWLYESLKEEHIGFTTNGERPSVDRWTEIESIETHGIFNSSATLRVHTGFSKRAVREQFAFWEGDDVETLLIYTVENLEFGDSDILPVIQFKVPEVTNPMLRQQGFSNDTIEYEMGIMLSEEEYLPAAVVGFERIPFTRWLLLATSDKLYVASARMPHLFSFIKEDENGENIVSRGLKARSAGPELNVFAESNWINHSEDGTEIAIQTRHTKPVRSIRSTRLSVTYDSPYLVSPVTKYYDWSGTEININTDSYRGFIMNTLLSDSPTDWHERRLVLDVYDTVEHPAWVAVVKLETRMTDNTTETDVFIVHSDVRTVDQELSWPAEIVGKVNGITYDAHGRLLVRTTDSELWQVNLYWDYCLVDYTRNVVYLREEYDSVQVTA